MTMRPTFCQNCGASWESMVGCTNPKCPLPPEPDEIGIAMQSAARRERKQATTAMTGKRYGLALAVVAERAALKGMSLEDVAAEGEKRGLEPIHLWTEAEIREIANALQPSLSPQYNPFEAGYGVALNDLIEYLLHSKKGGSLDAES